MVKLFKLVTGEDVIAVLKESIDDFASSFRLENPMVLLMQQDQSGNLGLGIAEFMPLKEGDSVELKDHAIVSVSDPDEKIKNQYNAKFGSGIILPEGSGKIIL